MPHSRTKWTVHLVRAALLSLTLTSGLGAVGGVVAAVTATPIAAHAASSMGGQITRSEVLSRARDWYNRRYDSDMTYSNVAYASDVDGNHSYRRDCSGYVDMALHWNTSDMPDTWQLQSSSLSISESK